MKLLYLKSKVDYREQNNFIEEEEKEADEADQIEKENEEMDQTVNIEEENEESMVLRKKIILPVTMKLNMLFILLT
jgi:hypothetical protein